jgi:type II secretory pathway pseudopilin PulG
MRLSNVSGTVALGSFFTLGLASTIVGFCFYGSGTEYQSDSSMTLIELGFSSIIFSGLVLFIQWSKESQSRRNVLKACQKRAETILVRLDRKIGTGLSLENSISITQEDFDSWFNSTNDAKAAWLWMEEDLRDYVQTYQTMGRANYAHRLREYADRIAYSSNAVSPSNSLLSGGSVIVQLENHLLALTTLRSSLNNFLRHVIDAQKPKRQRLLGNR